MDRFSYTSDSNGKIKRLYIFIIHDILINCLSVLFQLLKTALTLTYYFCNFVIEGLVWKRIYSITIVFELPSSPMYMLATGLCYSCSTL